MTKNIHIDNIITEKLAFIGGKMKLYPNFYFNNILEITIPFLHENAIQGLILDMDNTLIDFDRKLLEGTEQWVAELKENGIQLCIVSNSNHKEKVKTVAKRLQIPYFYFAKKPLKSGFKKAKEKLGLENKQIAAVGDQIFTDVLGANRSHMISILVEPIGKKDIWITRLKRPLENAIIQRGKRKLQEIKKKTQK